MSQPSQVPAQPGSPTSSSGVRRHHTISALTRSARANPQISEETAQEEQPWNEDEVVGEDWVGGVGAVGEKSGLHRQSSLPTRYHRAFQSQASSLSRSGSLTAKNSLTAIAGHEGDEDDWEGDIGAYGVEDEHPTQEMDPNSPHPANPAPGPPAASAVRRNVSLTYGAPARQAQKQPAAGLRRAGTLQATGASHQTVQNTEEQPAEEEEQYDYAQEEYDESEYYAKHPGPASPIGRLSPWSNGGTGGNGDWRAPSASFSGGSNVDDVQRALSALELGNNTYPSGQSAHPPRFNPTHSPGAQAPGLRNNNNNNLNNNGNGDGNGNNGRKLQLVTDFDGRKTPLGQQQPGPASASALYVLQQAQQQQQYLQQQQQQQQQQQERGWDQQQQQGLQQRRSNPNLNYGYNQKNATAGSPVPSLPAQYQPQRNALASTPIDVPSLIASKGYNPAAFELRPPFARYFVIKSYTEDDVHKSLKYEIWSSTEPGNKRLDKAFKECAGRGPIYLFFSVNASGHFCGMAEMLTPVDYTRSSTVWASDKWKGVFKVRWIFVRDIPNVNLRHIKLLNTTERKPVTNSRDTQELLAEAGHEMLRIFHTHPARTSLLQDFAFYELQAMQKLQGQGSTPGASSPSSPTTSGGSGSVHSPQLSPPLPHQQHQQQSSPFGMGLAGMPVPNPNMLNANPNALAYQMPQMTPMMQMQMMGMQMGVPQQQQQQFGHGHGQQHQMHQSVMRHPSPGPAPGGGDGGQQQQQQGFGGF